MAVKTRQAFDCCAMTRVVTAHSSMKFVQWNADNKSCRRTSLGPTFGGPITHMCPLTQQLVHPTSTHHLTHNDFCSRSFDMALLLSKVWPYKLDMMFTRSYRRLALWCE